MQMFTTHLTDEQLLALAKIALAPGGVVGDWGNALQEAGIDTRTAVYLGTQGYIEPVTRHAAGGDLSYFQITDKGRRDLALRFVG
jgi:hypothetical protein